MPRQARSASSPRQLQEAARGIGQVTSGKGANGILRSERSEFGAKKNFETNLTDPMCIASKYFVR